MVEFAATGLQGWGVSDSNTRLRFFFIFFVGVVAFAVILFWRGQLLFVAEYQEFPLTQKQWKIKKENYLKQQGFGSAFVPKRIDY